MGAFVVSFARHGENTTDRSKRYRREVNEKFRLKAISDDNHAVSSRQALGSLLFSGDAATVLDAPTLASTFPVDSESNGKRTRAATTTALSVSLVV